MTTIAGAVSSMTMAFVRSAVKTSRTVSAMSNLYTCLSCDKESQDHTLFKIVSTGKIGFVVCLECLRTW